MDWWRNNSSTSVPAILIPHQKLPIWSKGSIFRECSHPKWRTARAYKKQIKYITNILGFLICFKGKGRELQTSIQPQNQWLWSWVYFSFNKVVKQSSLFLVIHTNITRELLKPHLGLSRKLNNLVRMRQGRVSLQEKEEMEKNRNHWEGFPCQRIHALSNEDREHQGRRGGLLIMSLGGGHEEGGREKWWCGSLN